jgi:cell division septation protein DedD
MSDAEDRVNALKAEGIDAFTSQSNGKIVVKLGTFSSRQNADSVAGKTGAIVVPIKN